MTEHTNPVNDVAWVLDSMHGEQEAGRAHVNETRPFIETRCTWCVTIFPGA